MWAWLCAGAGDRTKKGESGCVHSKSESVSVHSNVRTIHMYLHHFRGGSG
jgi:hypothetical protein